MKQKYYSLSKILKLGAEYNLLLGERSNGKSYATKEYCIRQAYEKNELFGYLRRYNLDIKPSKVEQYLADAPITTITNGEYTYISVYRGKIYLANIDDNGKTVRGKLIGFTFDLAGAEHYKSMAYQTDTPLKNLIYEEFLTTNGYLCDEPRELMQLVSTIARREKIRVFLIGNTINRTCPYFYDWELKNIPKQKQGTIEIYNQHTGQLDDDNKEIIIKIAVEFCENSGKNSKMFFGKTAESITSGTWETKNYPNISDISEYSIVYALVYSYQGFAFVINLCYNEKGAFIYIYPSPHKKYDRIITQSFSENILTTNSLNANIKAEKLLIELFKLNKIVYSDNLTASDFLACNNDFKIF